MAKCIVEVVQPSKEQEFYVSNHCSVINSNSVSLLLSCETVVHSWSHGHGKSLLLNNPSGLFPQVKRSDSVRPISGLELRHRQLSS